MMFQQEKKDLLSGKGHRMTQKGFTLVETMMASCVLSIGLLAVASMQTTAIFGNANAFEMTEATTLAENMVEEFMLRPFDDPALEDADADGDAEDEDGDGDGIDDDGGNFGLDDNTVATADGTMTQGEYTIFWNVADGVPVPNSPTSQTKTIRVFITWPNANNSFVSMEYVKADKY